MSSGLTVEESVQGVLADAEGVANLLGLEIAGIDGSHHVFLGDPQVHSCL